MKIKLFRNSLVMASSLLATSQLALAVDYTWTQLTAATQTWTTAGNWASSTPFVSGSGNGLLFFAGTSGAGSTVANGTNNITGSVPAALSMNVLTLNGLGTASGSSTVNIASTSSTWTIGDGTTSTVNLNGLNGTGGGTVVNTGLLSYNVAANLALNQANTTFTGNGNAVFHFSGNISQVSSGYGITKTGSSILSLSGTNSYSGGSSVTGGALVFRNTNAKSGTGIHDFGSDATLGLGVATTGSFYSATDVDNAFAGSMSGSLVGITLNAATNIGLDTTNGNFSYGSSIGSVARGLQKFGANTLTLGGSNGYTGVTTIRQGTLAVASLADAGSSSGIGAYATAGAAGLMLNGGTFRYTGATTATNRGITHVGTANSGIDVSGTGVSLTMGASTIATTEALNITGGAGSTLTLGPITATAGQANFFAAIPTTLGAFTFSSSIVTGNRGTSSLTYGSITGSGASTLFLAAPTSGSGTTVNGVIGGFSGTVSISGIVNLLGTNSSYTGATNINGGTVTFKSVENVGVNSSLGAPALPQATIGFGNGTNVIGLTYTGTGNTTDRVLNLRGTTGTVTLTQSGTNLLKFTSNLSAGGAGSKTLVLSGSTTGTGELAGAIIDNSGTNKTSVSKTGTGTWTLSGVNLYTGTTAITGGGTLAINGTGSINNSSGLTITASTLRYNSSTALSAPLTFTSGTIAGSNWTGSLAGLTIGANKTISPGNSPGTATTAAQTWATGGSYLWEINNATGTAGTDPGWDLENGTGTLNISAIDGFEFNILVTSLKLDNTAGLAVNFANLTSYNWLIADFASITGFAADAFNINTTNFTNSFTGTFGISLGGVGLVPGDNSQIYLTYIAVPEPGAAFLGGLGLLALLRRRRA